MVAEDVKPTLTGQGRRRIASERLVGGFRLFVLSALLLAGVGAIGRLAGWVALTATLGPTAYVLLAHPGSVGARWRNAVSGHVLAVAVGLGCLAVFGLWDHPSVADQHHDTARQIGAQALAVGLTLFLLHVLDAHHAPAAAPALLIASGIARPGPPLYGLLTGLALVLAIAPLLTAATRHSHVWMPSRGWPMRRDER
ncbi:HPP family protein [Streptomyces longisporus]|uniref:HPP transmembrane region domain-containing protein n=1 Tax=Streptomyces longisporus TaxID=1948 RepID=A0ABN3LJL5_STRLO